MNSLVFVVVCLAGADAMRLMNMKDQIKPVQDESLLGLNLVNANAHKTLTQLRSASENTKIKPLLDAADQGLNLVEYEAKKDAKVLSDTMKSAEDAVKHGLEAEQKILTNIAEKEKQ